MASNVLGIQQIDFVVLHLPLLENTAGVEQPTRRRRIVVDAQALENHVHEFNEIAAVQEDSPSVLPAVSVTERQRKVGLLHVGIDVVFTDESDAIPDTRVLVDVFLKFLLELLELAVLEDRNVAHTRKQDDCIGASIAVHNPRRRD